MTHRRHTAAPGPTDPKGKPRPTPKLPGDDGGVQRP
jgi:hypothetical protein